MTSDSADKSGPLPAGDDRPLLIETVDGEDAGAGLAGIGEAMVLLGGVAILIYIVIAILAGPALDRGWEGTWFRLGPQYDLVLPIMLVVMFSGLGLHLVGWRHGAEGSRRRRPSH